MRRVVFWQPDLQIAEGLKRSMRVYQQRWELTFLETAEEVLAAAPTTQAVICDASTPDAERVLGVLKTQHPALVRATLAPMDTAPDAFARLQALSHQVLRKPMLPALVFDLVERVFRVFEALENERLKTVIGQLGDLPPLPATYSKISQMTQDPEVSMDSVAAVVERDPAITAAVLRIINSAYFGLPRRVSSVRETVRFLGIVPLKNLVLTVEVFEGLATGRRAQSLQQEALLRAYAMRELFGRTPHSEAAFIGGVLSEVGQLLLLSKLPVDAMAIERSIEQGRLPWDAQHERLGCTSAHLGAQLLARWNMPNALVEAVALHHDPPESNAGPNLATGLALVSAVEWSLRAPETLRSDFRKTSLRLLEAFPSAQLGSLERYFGHAEERVA